MRRRSRRAWKPRARGEIYLTPPGAQPGENRLLEQEARYRWSGCARSSSRRARRGARAAEAARPGERFFVQAPVLGDENAAMQLLTELVDAGFDGTLVSNQTGSGIVLYEIRLGPFDTLDEAQRVGTVVQNAHGLTSSVLVEPGFGVPEEEAR